MVDLLIKDVDNVETLNLAEKSGRSATDIALMQGKWKIAKRLIRKGGMAHNVSHRLSSSPTYSWTLLHSLCRDGKFLLVQHLLSRAQCVMGVDINKPDPHGWTPLHVAVLNRHTRLTALLTDAGGSAMLPVFANRWYPIHTATKSRDRQLLSTLLERSGVSVLSLVESSGWTCLDMALQEDCGDGLYSFLLHAGATLAAYNNRNDGWTPLHKAARTGNLHAVNSLLSHDPDLVHAAEHQHGRTALHIAGMSHPSPQSTL